MEDGKQAVNLDRGEARSSGATAMASLAKQHARRVSLAELVSYLSPLACCLGQWMIEPQLKLGARLEQVAIHFSDFSPPRPWAQQALKHQASKNNLLSVARSRAQPQCSVSAQIKLHQPPYYVEL